MTRHSDLEGAREIRDRDEAGRPPIVEDDAAVYLSLAELGQRVDRYADELLATIWDGIKPRAQDSG